MATFDPLSEICRSYHVKTNACGSSETTFFWLYQSCQYWFPCVSAFVLTSGFLGRGSRIAGRLGFKDACSDPQPHLSIFYKTFTRSQIIVRRLICCQRNTNSIFTLNDNWLEKWTYFFQKKKSKISGQAHFNVFVIRK